MTRLHSWWVSFVRAVRLASLAVFGRWRWEAPIWIRQIGRAASRGAGWVAARTWRAATVSVLFCLLVITAIWYVNRPRPHYVTFAFANPELTTYNEKGERSIKPLKVSFSEPAAPLKHVKTAVTSGIEVSPAIAGTWFWTSDRELQFAPRDDWPIDASFSVKFNARVFVAPQVRLDRTSFKFKTAAFNAMISESQFYQDPRDPNLKKLVATVSFTHAVDTAQFEHHVSLLVAKDAAYLGLRSDSRNFSVAYDKLKLAAFIHSTALAMPRDDTPMTLRVDKGVRAARGGNDTRDRLEAVVLIPGRTSLRFANARMTVVDNARYEPEQLLVLSSSSPVSERAFGNKVTVRLLPVRHPRQAEEDKEPYQWRSPEMIGEDILATCDAVPVAYVPAEERSDTTHAFKFRAPVGRYLHVEVHDGIQGTGGYLSAKAFVATIKVEPYPRALTFLGEGSLLSLSGDKKVAFLVRDVGHVQVEIGRVLPNQLQHLAPVMWNYSRPSLSDDMENGLVDRVIATRDYTRAQPGKPTYDSIDLSQYMATAATVEHGLFLLHIRSVHVRSDGRHVAGIDDWESDSSILDSRLLLVTDLGFIVKQAKDGGRDIFVQSIRTGLPVGDARVTLLGRNGLAAMNATTDAGGHAQFPKPPLQLKRDKEPQIVVVQKDGDLSFMPFNSGGRNLDTSRFDTGGIENAASAMQVSTYLFSDRGLYRPGETTHLGLVTRTADWKTSLTGLPLDVEITDPRGLIVNRTRVTVSAAGFDEITFNSGGAAPTGTYEAVAYLARDEKHRELLGSTTFRLQEFEPDRLKVQLDLSSAATAAWLRPDEVKPRVTVAHLFGEAATQRRVEGELSLTPTLPHFPKYPDYRFQIGEVLKDPYHETLAAAMSDDHGIAQLELDLQRFAGRAYRVNVLARAFEAAGGRNVAAQSSALVADAPYLVGVKPDGDLSFVRRSSARQASWLAVNQQLTPVAADGLTLEWVQRKYVSVLTEQRDGTMKYVSRRRDTVRSSRPVHIAAGGSLLPLPTTEPGDFILILRDSTGAALNTLSYTVAGDANISRSLDRESELQIQLDKSAYAGGDTIDVNIRAPYVGAGLITIERDRVFHYQWFKTTTTSSVQHVVLPREFEGNGYVSVEFLRDPSSPEIFMSPLSYGVAAFEAATNARRLSLDLVTPRQVRPGEVLSIRLTSSESSRVALFAVDEGILQVARYRTPDPLGYFFQKRMLEVNTKQILDLILPEFAQLMSRAAPGGDADGGFSRHVNPFNKKRKPPVTYWSGLINVGPAGRTFQYTVPDYFNGRLRIVAVSVNAQRVGVAETGVEVKGDFILTPNVPASVSPGDEFTVTVGVFNNSTSIDQSNNRSIDQPVDVEITLGSGLAFAGPSRVELQIAPKREGVAQYRLKANAQLGSTPLTFSAHRGATAAHIEETIGIRPATPFRTTLSLGKFLSSTGSVAITRDLFVEKRDVQLAMSTIPLVWGQGLVEYLEHYEYTCTEQLVSKGIAALMLLARPEFGRIANKTERPLDPTFATIRMRLNDTGGLGLWSSSPITSEFATIYGAHFLIEAKERDQKIPADVLASLNDWLTRFASTPASTLSDARLRAYAVYLLARQGIKPANGLSNVEQELANRHAPRWQMDLAAAYLAATYRLMQRNQDAERLIAGVPWAATKRDFADDIYYGDVVHDAQLLYLIARHFPARIAGAPPIALETMAKAVSGSNASSLSAAYTLLALDAYAKTTSTTATLGANEIDKEGHERAITLSATSMPKASVSTTAASVKMTQQGAPMVYYVLAESGFDRPPSPISLPAGAGGARGGLEILREFTDANGTPITRVKIGDDFFVRLRVRAVSGVQGAPPLNNARVQPQIAVVDMLPGGVEPVLELQPPSDSSTPEADPARMRGRTGATALPVGIPEKSDWGPYHVNVRDDRLILYGDATPNVATFVYRVRASTAGVFHVPPAFAEGLYNRTIFALTPAAMLEVVQK